MEAGSKKPLFLSRLKSTLNKDIWTKLFQKKRPIQSPAGRLPQELTEYIIDHLWYHFDSLLACCLTCRAWVEPSRYHLFYRRRLIYEHQYKSLIHLRRSGLVNYVRRIELDFLPPYSSKSPTFRHLKDMGPARSLRALALSGYDLFHLPESMRLMQATSSLVTLELTDPGGALSSILRFICLFPNLDNLSVVRHSKNGIKSTPHYETSPSFRGVLTLEHTDCTGEDGIVQGLLNVPGGLRFHKLVLKCNKGAELLIPACSRTLRTLFYQPRKSGVVPDPELYDLSKHLLLEKIETTVCSKTSIVPPTFLHHLTSRISSFKFRDLIITTHDHDFHDLAPILSATAEKVVHNLLPRRNGIPDADGMRTRVTYHIEDPLWNGRDREQLVREICPTILEESEAVVVVQKRNLAWTGVCRDQSGMGPMAFIV